jgi:thioredoxin 1
MSQQSGYQTLTQDNFDAAIANTSQPVLVDFWAQWCGPCLAMAPVIERLAAEYRGRAEVAKVDVDANPGLAARYGVQSIPTILFFQGGAVVDQVIGLVPKSVLEDKLDALSKAA